MFYVLHSEEQHYSYWMQDSSQRTKNEPTLGTTDLIQYVFNKYATPYLILAEIEGELFVQYGKVVALDRLDFFDARTA